MQTMVNFRNDVERAVRGMHEGRLRQPGSPGYICVWTPVWGRGSLRCSVSAPVTGMAVFFAVGIG
jgi:hypothetical protein